MIRSCSCLVLAAAFQVIFGQAEQSGIQPTPPTHRVPKHCLAPPPGVDLQKCCPITPIFSDEDLKSCGIEKGKNRPRPRQSKGPCDVTICLMENADLLLGNQSVDYDKLRDFIDKWENMNPNFAEVITGAKSLCANDGGPPGPPVCEHDRVFICITSNVLWNCKLQDLDGTNGCQVLKEHMNECRQYYL